MAEEGVHALGQRAARERRQLDRAAVHRAPADLRGTAFGVFNLASGVAMLVASAVAGALWDVYGPIATFLAGAAFTVIALVGLLGLRKQFGFQTALHQR